MRVLSIAELLALHITPLEGSNAAISVHILKDGAVVVRTYCKGVGRKARPLLQSGIGTALLQNLRKRRIHLLACNNNHILIVLCSSSDKRYAAYIYLFYNLLMRSTCSHILLKRIEVYNNKVYLRNIILLHLLQIHLILSSCQNASKDLWMECLYSASQNRGITCKILHLFCRNSLLQQKFVCSSGGENLHIVLMQQIGYLLQSLLVID